jgi:hypothetical protein
MMIADFRSKIRLISRIPYFIGVKRMSRPMSAHQRFVPASISCIDKHPVPRTASLEWSNHVFKLVRSCFGVDDDQGRETVLRRGHLSNATFHWSAPGKGRNIGKRLWPFAASFIFTREAEWMEKMEAKLGSLSGSLWVAKALGTPVANPRSPRLPVRRACQSNSNWQSLRYNPGTVNAFLHRDRWKKLFPVGHRAHLSIFVQSPRKLICA